MNQKLSTLLFAATLWAGAAAASAPPLLPLQGVLTDQNGVAINGATSVRFSLHTAETAGTEVWNDTFSVAVVNGLFATYLGSQTALPLTTFRDQGTLWLETKVETDLPMARVRLGSVAWAGYAEHCGVLPSHTHSFTEVTSGSVPATALPASVLRGPLSCAAPSDVVRGVDAAGALQCSAVAWADVANRPALVPVSQACNGTDKVTGLGAAGLLQCGADLGSITGSGTTGALAMFTDAGVIGDSPITVIGTNAVVLPAFVFGAGPGSSLNADMVDGLHASAFAPKLPKVLTVAPSGADFTSVSAAIASVTGVASSSNRYLVHVAPGTYVERFAMVPYVDVQGSGPNMTRIYAAGGTTFAAATAVVQVADNAELRDIWIESTGGTVALGVYSANSYGAMYRVKISVGSATASYGLALVGISSGSTSFTLHQLDITASATGTNQPFGLYASANIMPTLESSSIRVYGGTGVAYGMYLMGVGTGVVLRHSTLETYTNGGGAYGVYMTTGGFVDLIDTEVNVSSPGGSAWGAFVATNSGSGHVNARGGRITAANAPVRHGAGNLFVNSSLQGVALEGAASTALSGALKCAGVYDEAGDFFAGPACP